jgi:mannose-6-phosphate isomerase-like protein (cupin superfamily)
VGDGYLVKRLCIHAGRRISLQRHGWRSEHWLVVGGDGLLECGGEQRQAGPGTSLVIPLGAVHRASAGSADLLIVEVQRGEHLCEDDIERLADDFGRLLDEQVDANQVRTNPVALRDLGAASMDPATATAATVEEARIRDS